MKKLILLLIINTLSLIITNKSETLDSTYYYETKIEFKKDELLYNNIWGTIYNAEKKQCDDTPFLTGDGSKINPDGASNQRWVAICHEMLSDSIRSKMLNDPNSDRFKGKIKYGDTIWIESNNPNINGWWVVHDAKHKRVRNSIDFLQTKGDGSLYDNNKLWCGRFFDIKIYKYNKLIKIIKKSFDDLNINY